MQLSSRSEEECAAIDLQNDLVWLMLIWRSRVWLEHKAIAQNIASAVSVDRFESISVYCLQIGEDLIGVPLTL